MTSSFSEQLNPCPLLPPTCQSSGGSTFSPTFGGVGLFNLRRFAGCAGYFLGFDLHFRNHRWERERSPVLPVSLDAPFCKMPFHDFYSLFLLLLILRNSLSILDTKSLSALSAADLCGLLLYSRVRLLGAQRLVIVTLYILSFSFFGWRAFSTKSDSWRSFLVLYSRRFIVLTFLFQSTNYLGVEYMGDYYTRFVNCVEKYSR